MFTTGQVGLAFQAGRSRLRNRLEHSLRHAVCGALAARSERRALPDYRVTGTRHCWKQPTVALSTSGRVASRLFDLRPEFRIGLERFVLPQLEVRAVEEIFQRVSGQNAVNDDPQTMALEVNAVVGEAEAVERAAGFFEFPKRLQIRLDHVAGDAAELPEDFQLKPLGHGRKFGGAGGVEDDLEKPHERKSGSAYGNRTRLSALRGPCPNR
jgi:hypothetical protein